ncbi:cadherin-like protein 26 [Hoplias malabaricus]|uniref:cadherin-like protein 26 n=1 Tax=Hoplias malabaricus TaxID=27720 RepID=UPI00346372A0
MRIISFQLLLLAFWTETTQSDLSLLGMSNTQEHERVLIRTKRRWVLSTIELEEEDPGPYPKLATRLFNDKESADKVKFTIKGTGVDTEPIGVFSIKTYTGEVYVHKPIDREKNPTFLVEFDVWDRFTNEVLDKTLSFNVAIKDINDNAPQFSPKVLRTQIPENIKEGVIPASLQAKDDDEDGNVNSRITVRIVSQTPPSPVISIKQISRDTDKNVIMQLVFTGCFDYEKEKLYTLLVEAKDQGVPALSSTGTVLIEITDSNTHPPVFKSTKYDAQVMEMETDKVILRLPVEDKDTPNTPGSRPVFRIVKGNEDGYYKIETDPITNEGVLTVIKGKDYERTTMTELEIAVENEEALFVCVNGKPVPPETIPGLKPNTTKVAVKVIDVNDAPVFQDKTKIVYRKEEGKPGDELYQPIVRDVDSDISKIRYELADDPAKWMTIDPKTGKVTTVKKMDRESPFVQNNTYTVLIHAIDDGEPPATGTGTLIVHLGDLNDNTPWLVSNATVLCGNKADRMTVKANDADAAPFNGPYTFSIDSEDKELHSTWKFYPSTGFETSLISQKSLPYGSYTVPMNIHDQQGLLGKDVLHVTVCDCGELDICRSLHPRSSSLGGAAIGVLLGSLLLMALILCACFFCDKKRKQRFLPYTDEGDCQTIINYNEEGGGALAKSETLVQQSSSAALRSSKIQLADFANGHQVTNSSMKSGMISSAGFQQMAEASGTLRSPAWMTSRSFTFRNGTGRFSRSFSVMSDWNIEDHLTQKLQKFPEDQLDFPQCGPHEYSQEGSGSLCKSLDKLSFSTDEDNLDFLQNLGPKFQTLEGVCQKAVEEKHIKL